MLPPRPSPFPYENDHECRDRELESQWRDQINSARYHRFRKILIPLMATVMQAHRTGHPDFSRHLQALSDLINSGVE